MEQTAVDEGGLYGERRIIGTWDMSAEAGLAHRVSAFAREVLELMPPPSTADGRTDSWLHLETSRLNGKHPCFAFRRFRFHIPPSRLCLRFSSGLPGKCCLELSHYRFLPRPL
jgi:hypothetical protein